MAVPDVVRSLCETFLAHKDHYKSTNYNETELRREFLDPFFKALGWDVDNEAGYADAYKDVIHEDAIKMGGYTKAPDYCFRIGGARKFFVEAKKPFVTIRDDAAPAYQLRRYGWSAKLSLSILSDFEELAIYDTRIKPTKNDKPSTGRILYYSFDQYVDKWDEIAAVFSRDAVLKGSFDKYAETSKGKRGTGAVDETFLAEIERWRDTLARNLALRNQSLSVRDLNYAVQKIIDRIIFLRICEDRGTEDYGRLQSLQNGNRTYVRLMQLFMQADDRYNSGLFHFDQGEKGRPSTPDTLTPDLAIDDAVLKVILKNLYYPDSPFEFSVLPADILGQVYEQFLGKTIRLTASHQAKIEDKPEVRKAGGVYYTPGYIVDYIVKNTLGRLLDGEDPDHPKPISINKAAEIKVLDPACGSGSFLIVAYQALLDWHLQQYSADPVTGERDEKKIKKYAGGKNPQIYQGPGDVWRLTTSERKRILLNNIYGVDIDSQAVEVTKLSLLLKVLEGETQQHLQRDFIQERQRILPDLGHNIQCGNSLIGPDFYDNEQMFLLDEETQYRINVFDWKTGFPDVMKRGGFDCVIGNPPYIFTRELITTEERNYYSSQYKMGWEKQNTYMLFMESLLRLVSKHGLGSFIVPNSWLTIESAKLIRRALIPRLLLVVDLNYLVFDRVSMEPSIFVLVGHDTNEPVWAKRVASKESFLTQSLMSVNRNDWSNNDERISISSGGESAALTNKLRKIGTIIEDIFDVRTGLQAYECGKGKPPQTPNDVKNHIFDCWSKIDASAVRYLGGRDVSRYHLGWGGMWMRYGNWLAQPREQEMFTRPRVLIREITSGLPHCIHAMYTNEAFLNNKSILSVFDRKDNQDMLLVLCAILNSKLISIFYKECAVKGARKVFPKIVVRNLREFPMPKKFDLKITATTRALVERMLDLNKKKATEKNPNILKQIETQITATDRQIDRLVYELYGLSEEEVAMVENQD
jgi:hypothetical protein